MAGPGCRQVCETKTRTETESSYRSHLHCWPAKKAPVVLSVGVVDCSLAELLRSRGMPCCLAGQYLCNIYSTTELVQYP